MKRAHLRPQAESDLLEAVRHCANEGGVDVAERLFDAAVAALEPIERTPGIGSARLGPPCEIPGLRSGLVTGFPMQWPCFEAEDQLDVVRLLGDRQDIMAILTTTATTMSRVLFDFADPDAARAWRAIDDRVMGGVSRSTLRHDPAGHAVYEGVVSLDRNGGFASVRSSPGERGLSGAEACLIEVRGDSKPFRLSLLTGDGFDILSHQAGFAPAGARWETLRLPLADFRASFRGREVGSAPALDPASIRQVGLMIAARQAGRFELHIRRIGLA